MTNEKTNQLKKRKGSSSKKRAKNLLMVTDSAIERLATITQPGGVLEDMDIKDLKNLISSIKDLTTVSNELQEEKEVGGVVLLPEVKENE